MIKPSFEHTQAFGTAPVEYRDDSRDFLPDKKFRHPPQILIQAPIALNDQHKDIGKDGEIFCKIVLHYRAGVHKNQIVGIVHYFKNLSKGLGIIMDITGFRGKQGVNAPKSIMEDYLIQLCQ